MHQTHGFAGTDHWHSIIVQFYDVLHISVKSALFPNYMRDPKSIQKYFVDPVLASPLRHELILEILVAYFQSQIWRAWSVATNQAIPVHTVGSEAGASDTLGLFGGIGQCPGVPEPEKDLSSQDIRGKEDGSCSGCSSHERPGGYFLLFRPGPHHPLWLNQHLTQRELAI